MVGNRLSLLALIQETPRKEVVFLSWLTCLVLSSISYGTNCPSRHVL